ncbi:hypothetical protein PENSPDRAFT_62747 [Peniophora sp. CONT]|nr:hypothetical protein PENSPDRAFT_62747 [Peniophora sp. CONT]
MAVDPNASDSDMTALLKRMQRAVRSSQTVLTRTPCAHSRPEDYFECPNEGTKTCSECKLVLYCSRLCQERHWKLHKKVHKDALVDSQWKPAWEKEGRPPSWTSRSPEEFDPKTSGSSLWGNMPAIDVLNFVRNKDLMKSTSLNVLFAASGDLRNAIKTVNALPDTFQGELTITLNDRDPFVSLRNIMLLRLLGADGDPRRAADAALHHWYSVLLPRQYHTEILALLSEMGLKLLEDQPSGADGYKLGVLSSLQVIMGAGSYLRGLTAAFCAQDKYTAADAKAELNGIRFDPSRRDLHDKSYSRLEPPHRLSIQKFRECGLVLPFGASTAHFDTPNYMLFSPSGKWSIGDGERPLFGWNIEDIVASGRAHGLTRYDLYGSLYFHVSELLCDFAKRLSRFRIKFIVLNEDAVDLATNIQRGDLKDVGIPATARFDRIDVSNIMDANYVGVEKVIGAWGPLLRRARTSALLGYFMNWAMGDKSKPKTEDMDELKRSGRTSPQPSQLDPMAWMTWMTDIMNDFPAYTDTSKAFDRYLVEHKVTSSLRQARLKLRQEHTVLPHRLCVPIDAQKTVKPGPLLSEESWYLQAQLGGFTWNERFVEIVCADP